MITPEVAAAVAGGAALVSSFAAAFTAIRQGRMNRQLVKLLQINIERREFRDGLLLLGATSRVVAERGDELCAALRTAAATGEVRPKFEAFSAAAEYLLQAWTTFSTRVEPSAFGEVRESISHALEAAEGARLGWLVMTSDGPPTARQTLAGYADTASRWSAECRRMCATGAQASGVLIARQPVIA
ncbi:MAG: hypothetical protein R2715_04295 [Ilumatobacteraceae bacterium]